MLAGDALGSQRIWARIAGLMFWVVLLADLSALQFPPGTLSHSLFLAGSLFTVPLALGLYYTLRRWQAAAAAAALFCRLFEADLGIISTLSEFAGFPAHAAGTALGSALLRTAQWNDANNIGAFAFTVGSAIFFFLFVQSRYIPRLLAVWGLFASLLALAACLTHLSHHAFPAMTMAAWIPMLLAETSTGAWLLIKSVSLPGVTPRRP